MSHRGVVWLLSLVMLTVTGVYGQVSQSSDQEPPKLAGPPPVPAFCSFGGPFVRVPSRAAGSEGILVRVSPPANGRYPTGAPVAVHMFAAAPSVSGSVACLNTQGFVDIGFLCPGAQYTAPDGTVLRSGGEKPPGQADWRNCVEPLADVLSFATGQTRSLEGKSIQDYVAGVRILTENAGVVGWSFGGNLAVLAMARYGERFSSLKWYASWESPMLGPVDDGGGSIFQPNRYYDPGTGTVDFSRLRYSPDMPIWSWPILGLPAQPDWPRGGLYLDGDANGRFNRDADYGFWVDLESGPPVKAFYSPATTREAANRNVFGPTWPPHIANADEVERRASRDDALRHIEGAVSKLPEAAILVFESQRSHVSVAADHPHALGQVNAWLDARARWVRLNPDVHYVGQLMGKPAPNVQTPAMTRLDRTTIANALAPEAADGGPSDAQGMAAAACELADRTQFADWSPTLSGLLR